MNKPAITGQLIIRETGDSKSVAGPNRKLVMVFGVLAVPLDFPLQGEHQHVVLGRVDDLLGVQLTLPLGYSLDLAKVHKGRLEGWRADQLLTASIWKI